MLVAAPGSYTLTGLPAELVANRVVATGLTSGTSATDGTSFVTASVTPTADRLVLLTVLSGRNDSVNAEVPSSVTGNGLTWVQVATVAFDTGAATRHTITILRAMGAAPSTGAITINFSATHQSCTWSVAEFAGVDTGGTNGSAAVVQAVTAASAADADGLLSITLAAFGSAENGTYGAFGVNNDRTWTPGAGFTELHDLPQTVSPLHTLMTEWRRDNDTSVDAQQSLTGDDIGGIALEIKAGTPGFTLVASPGSYVLTGVAAAPLATRLLNAVAGSYALTGSSTITSVGRYLAVDPGAYSISGAAAGLLADRLITASPGTYTVTGVAANLVFTPPPGVFVLDAAAGVYTLTGVATAPTAARFFNLAAGSYLLTGTATSLDVGSATLSLIDHVGSTLTLVDHPETH